MRRILEGIRVVEWAEVHQGPGAAALFGDLGADVVKIERKDHGDRARGMQAAQGIALATTGGNNYYFEGYNRHKRSLAIDLSKERGREVVYRLVGRADVFLTSYRLPAVRALGSDYATLRQHNPRLIYCHASGFGPLGPDTDDPAFDVIAQARSGFMLSGMAQIDEPNLLQGVADQTGEIYAAYGVLAALLARERFGIGQEVTSSILGGIIALQRPRVQITCFTGQEPHGTGRRNRRNPLDNSYRGSDGRWFWLGISMITDRYWATLCEALGVPELVRDPRFFDWEKRAGNCTALVDLLDDLFAARPRDEWVSLLKDHDFPCGPVNTTKEMLMDPQVVANGYIVDYDHPVLGPVKLLGSPVGFSETPADPRAPAPFLGQHTEEVLQEIGYDWQEIDGLAREGVV